MMSLLTTQYDQLHRLYIVTPISGRVEDPDCAYVFVTEEEQLKFIRAYYRNPVAAMYAYHARLEGVA